MKKTGAGVDAENVALAFLESADLTLVERNYRSRFGEIDLVMRDGRTLVFVEVRMRSNTLFGGAAASVTRTKQERIIATANQFLSGRSDSPPCRFDVVLLSGGEILEWIRDAFAA